MIFFEKRRVFKFFEFRFFFRRHNVNQLIFVFLKLFKTIRDHMNFKQKIVNEINFFDKKIIKIAFDVFLFSKKFKFGKVFFLKFQKIIEKKIKKIKNRLPLIKND